MIDTDVEWPPYQIYVAEVANYSEQREKPETVYAIFGVISMLSKKFEALNTGGEWTKVPGFNPPELEGSFVAYISDDDVDTYDLDAIVAFLEEWGFPPTFIKLDMLAAPAEQDASAPAI